MSNNTLYSINFNDFTNWQDQEFACYNIETGKYTKLKSSFINGFRVNNSYLAILNSTNTIELYSLKDNYHRLNLDIGYVIARKQLFSN